MDKPIRILQMTGSLGYAGVESVIMNLYRCLDRSKVQFDFVVCEKEGRFDNEIEELGGKIYRLPSRSSHPIKYYKALKKLLKTHSEYKIFHCNTNSASGFIDLLAAKNAKVKNRILHSHNSNCIVKWQHNIFRHLLPLVVTNKFSCSREASLWMFKSESGVNIINNGVVLEKLKFNSELRAAKRNEMHCENKFIIGHIGSFQERKNQAFLADVFNRLQIKNKELWLIGNGETRPAVEQIVEKLGLAEKVKFLGNRQDIPELLQAMDYFVFPSKFEGLPVVLIEAQSSGLKCLASDTMPLQAKITGNIDYCSLDNVGDWVDCIERQKDYCRKAVDNDIQKAGYDMSQTVEWLQNYYFDLLKQS